MSYTLPTKFRPPGRRTNPFRLFEDISLYDQEGELIDRYSLHRDESVRLVLTDGACPNNGQANPRAGWGIQIGPYARDNRKGRLELYGPYRDRGAQTSNRAELRAVLAALEVKSWEYEGCAILVIATDSAYVTEGATNWVRKWLNNGWETCTGAPVKNQDLWLAVLRRVDQLADEGVGVRFWKIDRVHNGVADSLAKEAAGEPSIRFYDPDYSHHY